MALTEERILEILLKHAPERNRLHPAGGNYATEKAIYYYTAPEYAVYAPIERAFAQIRGGSGGELKINKYKVISFCSLKSSAALVYNLHATPDGQVELYDGKYLCTLEKKYKGIGTSNFDAFLERDGEEIIIEGKMLEFLSPANYISPAYLDKNRYVAANAEYGGKIGDVFTRIIEEITDADCANASGYYRIKQDFDCRYDIYQLYKHLINYLLVTAKKAQKPKKVTLISVFFELLNHSLLGDDGEKYGRIIEGERKAAELYGLDRIKQLFGEFGIELDVAALNHKEYLEKVIKISGAQLEYIKKRYVFTE